MSQSAGSVAGMIQRFREAEPMSRAERAAQRGQPTHMWWEDPNHVETTKNELTHTLSTVNDDSQTFEQPKPRDLFIRPAIPSLAPLYPSDAMIKRNQNGDSLVASIDLDELISKEISLLAQEMHRQDKRRIRESANSLASADNQVDDPVPRRRSPARHSSNLRNSRQRLQDEELRTIIEDEDEYANYFSSRKATERRNAGNRQITSTSIRLDDILHSSVETLGSAGFKALLLPELKLDGAKPVPEKKDEQVQGELKDVNFNLDELLKSLSDAREKIKKSGYLPEGVDETIPQITNKLNADMMQFKQLFDSKYSAEEELEKERKARDAEMKEIGRKEERETHALRLLDLDLLPDRNPVEFRRGDLSVDRALWRVDRSGHATLILPQPHSPEYNGPVNEMLVDHPPLLQEVPRNSRSGLLVRDDREGRHRVYPSQRERVHVSHNDAGRSYYQSGGRRQESMGKQREGSEEEEDFNAPSDIRKMFNPYPNLVHENILGISKGICSVLDVAMTILQTRLPNNLTEQGATEKPDLPTVTMPPSLIAAPQIDTLKAKISPPPFDDESVPSSTKDEAERAAPGNEEIKIISDDSTDNRMEMQPTETVPKSIVTSASIDGPEKDTVKPEKSVREQLDALDSVLGVDQSTNSDNFLDRMELLPFRATRKRDGIEKSALRPFNYGEGDDTRINNALPPPERLLRNAPVDSNRVRFMEEEESYPPSWNRGQGSSTGYADPAEASAPPIILSRDVGFQPSSTEVSMPSFHAETFHSDTRRVRSGGTAVASDNNFSPFAPQRRPAEGAAIRSLRQGTSSDGMHEYNSAAQSLERQKVLQFQYPYNREPPARSGNRSYEDKENHFRNQGDALETKKLKPGDISPGWMPESASRHDKVTYLADMKKLREQMQLIL